jgi:hypothetical protein
MARSRDLRGIAQPAQVFPAPHDVDRGADRVGDPGGHLGAGPQPSVWGGAAKVARSLVCWAGLSKSQGLDHPLAEARLVVAGDDVILARSDEELLSLLKRPGQIYLTAVVNLANIVEELRNAIAA